MLSPSATNLYLPWGFGIGVELDMFKVMRVADDCQHNFD